jgi:phosphoglycolate phosphatase-like HAD superfamily hydrolase
MTASDHYSRADIIAGAVAAAGGTIRTALYVGDGLWDYRACKKLGIPFIGIGHRAELLRGEGATHLLSSLMPEEFWRVRNAMGLPPWAH